MKDLFERARAFLNHDPDQNTRAELSAVLEKATSGDDAALKDLRDRFSGPLEFGTAGLRGVIGAGETRMNRAVVLRTTWGLGKYLLEQIGDAASRGVVIGYDARRMSREFAEDTAAVLAEMGIVAHLSPIAIPTPLTAFAVNYLRAAAGVMVTASHNPPEYNGYKVYWQNGAQIIPPHDKGIAAWIDRAAPADEVAKMSLADARAKGLVRDIAPVVERTYLDELQKLGVRKDGDRSFAIVYTPLHGVGDRLTRIALSEAGFTGVESVAEQAEPDGAFPTVVFPNPEEKGALDLSYALAKKTGADLILANDPDVDRLAVAVKNASGEFVQLSGNQVGTLLGHYLLTQGKKGDRIALASIVSSPQLGGIARALGVRYEETLTGFKWIANRAMEIEKETGAHFVFGYEEALGYTVGPLVRDKDGIGAAVVFAELAAVRRSEGKTLLDALDDIAREFGLYVSGQKSITMPGADGIAAIKQLMVSLRGKTATELGGLAVESTADLSTGVRKNKDGSTEKLSLPPSDVLVYALEGGSRIIARPSGTEPKIKFYFDVREEMRTGELPKDAEGRAKAKMNELMAAFSAFAGV
ncbi:MAG: phospho-sugar mutase [Polyangiaceae bacterium]|nr:phospho-sugar mutase [Polyangiaceae bacterium]